MKQHPDFKLNRLPRDERGNIVPRGPRWIHVSKTYEWLPYLQKYIASPGKTFRHRSTLRQRARSRGITPKRLRAVAKLSRREKRLAMGS